MFAAVSGKTERLQLNIYNFFFLLPSVDVTRFYIGCCVLLGSRTVTLVFTTVLVTAWRVKA
jgi:hypothetical protein